MEIELQSKKIRKTRPSLLNTRLLNHHLVLYVSTASFIKSIFLLKVNNRLLKSTILDDLTNFAEEHQLLPMRR